MNSRATQQYNMFPYMFMQFTGCQQPVQHSYWPENAIDWLRDNANYVRHARTHNIQLSGPTVHSLYCGQGF